jgi:hypothetical protein
MRAQATPEWQRQKEVEFENQSGFKAAYGASF